MSFWTARASAVRVGGVTGSDLGPGTKCGRERAEDTLLPYDLQGGLAPTREVKSPSAAVNGGERGRPFCRSPL